jgi:signal transduction histidine kinase
MSHEIRTPINAMIGYAELISMGISGPITPTQAEQLGRIRASGDHLTSLVNEILDLAKIEAGRMTIEPEVTSLASVAESAMSLIRPQAAAKGVEVDGAMDRESAIQFFGDPQRVAQIIANHLSNS